MMVINKHPLLKAAAATPRLQQVCEQESHGDHAGGVAPVLRAFATSEFADSGQRYPAFAHNDALQVARTAHVSIDYPRGRDLGDRRVARIKKATQLR